MALSVPPHITILPPIAVPLAEKEAVFEHLAQVAERSRPFNLSLDGSGTFEPISPVAFLNVAKGALQCGQLADDVRVGALDYPSRFPYHPHVTLAQGVEPELLDLALKQTADFQADWMVQGFRVDRVEEDGSYVSTAIFDFSSGAA